MGECVETRYGNTWPVSVLFICISLNLTWWKLRRSRQPPVKLTVTKIALLCSTRRDVDATSFQYAALHRGIDSSSSFARRSFIAVKAISRRTFGQKRFETTFEVRFSLPLSFYRFSFDFFFQFTRFSFDKTSTRTLYLPYGQSLVMLCCLRKFE